MTLKCVSGMRIFTSATDSLTRKSVTTHLRVVQRAVCLVLVTEPKTARR